MKVNGVRATVSLEILIIFLFLAPVAFLLLRATNDIMKSLAEDFGKTVLLYKAAANIKFANERIPLEGNTTVSVGLPAEVVNISFNGNRLTLLLLAGGEKASAFLPVPSTGSFTVNGQTHPTVVVIFGPNGNRAEVGTG